MKIVSDFDGVVTEQTEEAGLTRQLFIEAIEGCYDKPHTAHLIARADSELEKTPTQHGWRSQGRLTAYANEDLFVRNQGLAACLDDWVKAGDSECAAVAKVLHDKRGFIGFLGAAEWAYQEMCVRTARGEQKPLDEAALRIVEGWTKQGHEVVVVSNSSTARIVDLFKSIGLEAVDHAANPHAPLRVRGGARKFELGTQSRGFEFEGYWLDADRPLYERILREEKPGAVIGDVFSLDLGLPLDLSRNEAAFHGIKLCLRVRHYTPAWTKKLMQRDEKTAKFLTFDDFAAVTPFLAQP